MRAWMAKHVEGPGGIRVLLGIALPMIISMAAETIMMFVDRLFLSRLGPAHMAAGLAGGFSAFMVCTFFVGTSGYVNALAAQHLGAGRNSRCGLAGGQGVLLALASYPLVLMTLPLVSALFAHAGHDPEQTQLESAYFTILVYGALFVLVRSALSGFFCGIGRTRVVMAANTLALLVNIPANYVLIFGHFGVPALGIRGAAYGTLLGSATGMVAMGIAYLRPALRVPFATWSGLRFDRGEMKQLLRFGIPSGTEMFLNMAAFNAFVLLFHSYGRDAAAAITITLNWDLLAFLPLIGMGQAVTSLAGRYLGAGQPETVRRAAFSGLKSCALYGMFMSALFVLIPGALVRLFAAPDDPAYDAVVPLAITMLRLAAVYTVVDGVLVVFSGALRGVGDTHWTMKVSVSLHWAMAALSFVLIRVIETRPVTAWLGLIGFVLVIATVFLLRFVSERWRSLTAVVPGGEVSTALQEVAGEGPPDIV